MRGVRVGKGLGSKLRHPRFSKISTSNHLTFTEWKCQLPSLQGPPRSVNSFGISPNAKGKLEGRRCTRRRWWWTGWSRNPVPRGPTPRTRARRSLPR